MGKNLVIIPTYNEIENIEKMVRTVFELPREFELLIVDDGSPDGTAAKVKDLQIEYPGKLHIEERRGKLGLGTAYIHGFKWALSKDYDYIFEMDCDFSHNPNDLVRLLEACEKGADVAVGSRYCKGGKVSNWPLGRILMSYFASVYVRIVLSVSLERYKIGKSNLLETIETQKNLEDAQTRYIQALYNIKLAEADLLRVNGNLVK